MKFRARKDAVPAQIRGNTRLEVGWTLGAAVVLVVLAAVTFAMLDEIRTPPNSDADGYATAVVEDIKNASAFQPRPPNGRSLNIKVNGQRYVWRYTYPYPKADTPQNQRSPPTSSSSCRRRRRSRSTSRRRTSRTRGGSRSSAASSTPSPATRTSRGSRSEKPGL